MRAQDEQHWDAMLGQLRQWTAEHGTSWVPIAEGALGRWAKTQRLAYRQGQLLAHRAEALESLPGWSWDRGRRRPDRERWWDRFADLRQSIDRSQADRVVIPDSLRWWAGHQRRAAADGRLSPDQRSALESLPAWAFPSRRAQPWEATLEGLAALDQADGRLPADLDRWAAAQRKRYRAGQLNADQVRRLQQIPGWSWDGRQPARNRRWRAFVADVEAMAADEGDLTSLPANGPAGSLARRASNWRAEYRAGRLNPEQAAELARLPGWQWKGRPHGVPTPDMGDWYRKLDDLRALVDQRGSAWRLPAQGPQGHIGRWAKTQRQRRRTKWLTDEQIRALEHVNGWEWSARRAPPS